MNHSSTSFAAFLLAFALSGCVQSSDPEPGSGGAGPSSTGSGGDAPGAGGSNVGGASGEGGDAAGGGAASTGAGGDAGTGGSAGAISSCSTATLFTGNPWNTEEPVGQNPEGHPSLEAPPLRFHDIAFNGDVFGVATQSELWLMDTTADDPVYVRTFGRDDVNGYQPGACDDAVFRSIAGLAPLPDGEWLITDFTGNSILRVTGVGTADCRVDVVAGNAVPYEGVETTPQNEGDEDGPGASAKLNGPENLATDPEGNAYFIDRGNKKVKMLHNDAEHTVETIGDLSTPELTGLVFNALTVLDGNVYIGGNGSARDWVVRVSPSGTTTVIQDTAGAFDGVTGTYANLNAAAHDGHNIFFLGAAGRVWRVTPEGEVSSFIAGGGRVVGLNPDNYDFTMPFPAKEAPMQSQSTASDVLAIRDGKIYAGSVANGVGFWVWEFDCE